MISRQNSGMVGDKRFLELDALRGIAAFAVVLFHFTFMYDHYYGYGFWFPDFNVGGGWGVQLFFTISGFVIFFTINKVKSPKEFLLRRFIRLYPTYWICLIVTFVGVSIFTLLPVLEVSLTDALYGLTMLPQLFGKRPVDKSYWTLVPEFFFYINISILAFFGKIHRINLVGVFVLAFSLVHLHFYHIRFAGLFLNLDYFCYFFSGVLFFQLRSDRSNGLLWGLLLCCYAAGISTFADFSVQNILLLSSIYLIFILFIFEGLKWLIIPPLVFFGNISYALYLIHQNIGYIVINLLRPFIHHWTIIVFPILFSIALASAITFWVERPVMDLLKRKLLRRKRKSADTAAATATSM